MSMSDEMQKLMNWVQIRTKQSQIADVELHLVNTRTHTALLALTELLNPHID